MQPEISKLLRKKTYREALLKLSESDSIQLIINLSDSTVNLFIQGVMIHRSRIGTFQTDKLFRIMPRIQELKLLSQPLPVLSRYATIVKEPIIIRNAPKDPLEASLNVWQPDTLIQNPAFLILSLEHGINLIFEQDENPAFHDRRVRRIFYRRLFLRETFQSISNFACFKKQEYHPSIIILMPVDELRAIYRALPGKALVVLSL